MHHMKSVSFFAAIVLICVPFLSPAQTGLRTDGRSLIISSKGSQYTFSPSFVVLYNAEDPGMALRPAGIKKVSYNVLTWKTNDTALADFKAKKVNATVAGDGFDDRILRSKEDQRTASIYNAGKSTSITASKLEQRGDTILFHFPVSAEFILKAWLLTSGKPYPTITFSFQPVKAGYYSIGYTGAPALAKSAVRENWQPLIWTEKRLPDRPILTPAFMAPLPTTLVNDGSHTLGVLASPQYLPFQPLPTLPNSQFGVAVLNKAGQVQPQLFAPIPGGMGSEMKSGAVFNFSFGLVVEPQSLSGAYETIAKNSFGFRDMRQNAIASLNTVLDNIVDYSLSSYAWFIDSLKGCAYSTDVPGAVKNVSSLNPLELAIVRDDSLLFEKRAYPLMEFMLSREKFLFSLDSMQKIQSPSRKLRGPIAPLSELGALYAVFGGNNQFYIPLAEKEFAGNRTRNLDDNEKGHNWINAMFLYKMTGQASYLETAKRLAFAYIKQRVTKPQQAFADPLQGSHFFWPTFTNRWVEFLELYEITKEKAFLEAAHEGARRYTQFIWMAPLVPDSQITVNKGGKAPMYWYLKQKGHKQMYYPEETVPAWRLSEIGLTPESSGTSTGHRGIFMTNFAPWMMRVGYYTKDTFLVNVAKAATIGRYRNFPGYHINTERTTAYEQFDFPLHQHLDQSVNSFHYNHILPMASMLLDYLVTDAFQRSLEQINFPSQYIEGYAYLQNKMYGAEKGKFYTESAVQLWMPEGLLRIDNVELNYVAARKGDQLFLAFMNQSNAAVSSKVTINPAKAPVKGSSGIRFFTEKQTAALKDSVFTITVPANGITAIAVDGLQLPAGFQDRLLADRGDKSRDFLELPEGNARAILFKLGDYGRRLFVYLQDDDNKWQQAVLTYKIGKGKKQTLVKKEYPFEFTVPVSPDQPVSFSLTLTDRSGKNTSSKTVELGK
ncbi:MAG: hypothetical protein P0Y53_09285 [Candidatus Pseudobacter hemicellulosilyticus]|uniref:Uncharacterized protein n=1 Tax=Candidatus Pseudobacter hemicellulosilyticus TaxID=3121375 RepID=A0AAJ5WWW1_9BACT|nr:MAG: hypothetical protein P0Y53_09285 [Pseudobacter sp.]